MRRQAVETGRDSKDVENVPVEMKRDDVHPEKGGLAGPILIKLTIAVVFIVGVSASVSYLRVYRGLEEQFLTQLRVYIRERGLRDTLLFTQTRDMHLQLRDEFMSRYMRADEDDTRAFFERIFKTWDDGTMRTRREVFDGLALGRGWESKGITGFVGRGVVMTPERRRRLAITYDLLATYGPAYQTVIQNLYIAMHDNVGLIYWPSLPWDLEVESDFDMTQQDYFLLADLQHRPDRSTTWTSVYHDDVANQWMISCITPVDIAGQYVGAIGSDVSLNALFAHTVIDQLEGTINMILGQNGELIVSPGQRNRPGDVSFDYAPALSIQTDRIYTLIKGMNGTSVIEDTEDDAYLAVTRLKGPGWYLVTVMPREILRKSARTTAGSVLLSGALALLAMLSLVAFLLHRQILKPLQTFLRATETVGAENAEDDQVATLPTCRNDEIGVLARSFQQMTERLKEREEELRLGEEKYRLLADNTIDTIWALTPEFEFTYVNAPIVSLTGHIPEEWIGSRLAEHCDEEAYARIVREFQSADAAQQGGVTLEAELFRKDGLPVLVELHGRAIQPDEGGPAPIQVVVRDITERKRAEEKNRSLEAQLQQARKMESIGHFAGGVAHDFNNMLTGIMNYVELCRDQVSNNVTVRGYLDEVIADVTRSAELVRQLLAFARRQTIAPKVLDLNTAVESMLTMLRRLIGEDIDLHWQPSPGLWPVMLDPGQIDQILANLCVNARDAIEGVGKITIETENVHVDEDYCSQHVEAVVGTYVLLAVSDNGHGMDRETLANAFEPFFTTKETGKGTGLGLATVYGIVKQNHGFINVCSELGEGTTFRIYLPRSDGEVCDERRPVGGAERAKGTEIILLVEDEKSVRISTGLFLEKLGYTVLAASSPEEALSIARRYSCTIDLLITDVVMPGMNGRDLSDRLIRENPGMECLFISGYAANVIAHKGILDEGVNFLTKPFSRDELASCVRAIIDDRPRSG